MRAVELGSGLGLAAQDCGNLIGFRIVESDQMVVVIRNDDAFDRIDAEMFGAEKVDLRA